MVKLQADIWRKGITAGRSMQAVVDELLDATLTFLAIKVKAARRVKAPQKFPKERPRLRRVA